MYTSIQHYGWKPDLPDKRDLMYSAPEPVLKKLPPGIDLRNLCPSVYDQGRLGSCTANAIAAAFQFDLLKQKAPDFVPSRLFIYYNERSIENSIKTDSGAQIRDGMKSIGNVGVCPETMWPYQTSEFTVKPFHICYTDAQKHKAVQYHRLPRLLEQMKACLADGYPFIMGFTVYEGFESAEVAKTGELNLPAVTEKVVGGHAVLVVGYDDSQNRFIVRNSWGAGWGMKGYFTMPYAYLTSPDLSDDFWTIRVTMSNPAIQSQIARAAEIDFSDKTIVQGTLHSLPCATPGCGGHVYYDSSDKPIPAIVEDKVTFKEKMEGTVVMHLTCDNPVTRHSNAYTITL